MGGTDLPAIIALPGETVTLNQGGVLVSDKRVVFPDITLATANITSCRGVPEGKSMLVALFGGFLLLVAAIAGLVLHMSAAGAAAGGLGVVLLLTYFVVLKTHYWVVVSTAAGEHRAYSSTDIQVTSRILAALNLAIAARV